MNPDADAATRSRSGCSGWRQRGRLDDPEVPRRGRQVTVAHRVEFALRRDEQQVGGFPELTGILPPEPGKSPTGPRSQPPVRYP